MNASRVEEIANAVLYEGYMLYPYRPSSVKNRQRFNFGVLFPREYSESRATGEPWFMHTECLVCGSAESCVEVKVRFLHLISRGRSMEFASRFEHAEDSESAHDFFNELVEAAQPQQPWQEAVERDITVREVVADLLAAPVRRPFELRGEESTEARPTRQESLRGEIEISAAALQEGVYKISVRIANLTPMRGDANSSRDDSLLFSLVSAHAVLRLIHGEFVSLTDPPAELQQFTAECHNVGNWPVLVGDEGERDAMLASPIILYDYPQIAPESAGDLCDGTEIDEILALRILTLTDQEKEEMRLSDDRARKILERTESMPQEHFMKLHGVLRGVRHLDEEAK